MKVLVTGAAGFIGGQLWHTLWQRGDEVVGIDNFSYGNLDNLKFDDHDFGPEVRRMDIRDREALPKLFEGQHHGPGPCAGMCPPHRRKTGGAGLHQRYVRERDRVPDRGGEVQPAHPDLPQHQILRRALCPKLCRHLWHDRDLPALCQRLRPSHRLPAQAAAVCGLYDPRAVL